MSYSSCTTLAFFEFLKAICIESYTAFAVKQVGGFELRLILNFLLIIRASENWILNLNHNGLKVREIPDVNISEKQTHFSKYVGMVGKLHKPFFAYLIFFARIRIVLFFWFQINVHHTIHISWNERFQNICW